MLAIIFVFELQSRVDQCRRNFLQRRPEPIFLVGSKRDAEDLAVAVADSRREIDSFEERGFGQGEPDGGERHGDEHPASDPAAIFTKERRFTNRRRKDGGLESAAPWVQLL